MLLLKVFAAFCAADNTDEKKPPCPGVVTSGVGVNGAGVIFESLLGPNVTPEPDRLRRCDIMFPEGEVTTFGFVPAPEVGRSGDFDSLLENRGEPKADSVGVGGVFTMIGADLSVDGGVRGVALVSIAGILAVRGRSGDDVTEPKAVCEEVLSGNIEPSRDATLPRRFSAKVVASFVATAAAAPPALRSGLVFGLVPFLGVNASLNLPTGDGVRFWDASVGARSVPKVKSGLASEAASVSTVGKLADFGVSSPSSCASKGVNFDVSGRVVA